MIFLIKHKCIEMKSNKLKINNRKIIIKKVFVKYSENINKLYILKIII